MAKQHDKGISRLCNCNGGLYELRSREQIGYLLFSSVSNARGCVGFSVTVGAQAARFSPGHVDGRIEAFLRRFVEVDLEELSEGEFQAWLLPIRLFWCQIFGTF